MLVIDWDELDGAEVARERAENGVTLRRVKGKEICEQRHGYTVEGYRFSLREKALNQPTDADLTSTGVKFRTTRAARKREALPRARATDSSAAADVAEGDDGDDCPDLVGQSDSDDESVDGDVNLSGESDRDHWVFQGEQLVRHHKQERNKCSFQPTPTARCRSST